MKKMIAFLMVLIMGICSVSAATYYVSNAGDDTDPGTSTTTSWKTIAKLNSDGNHTSGDTILFNRGDTWNAYTDEILKTKDGVTYGDYGTGDKPLLYNGASLTVDTDWTEDTALALWNTTAAVTVEVANLYNVSGSISRNRTNSNVTLTHEADWMYEVATETLMINSSANPYDLYGDIILAVDKMIINITDSEDVHIYNLSLKYANDGIWGLNTDNIIIEDCEIAYMGGAYQSGTLRYGNGITFWLSSNNTIIRNNEVYQVYDAAITHQSNEYDSNIENAVVQNNIVYSCDQGYEFFNSANASGSNLNILVDGNSFINIGASTWGTLQRASSPVARAIRISTLNTTLDGTFTNNLFMNNSGVPFRWESSAKNWADSIITDYNNFFYLTGASNGTYYPNATLYRFNNQTEYIADRGQGVNDLFYYNPLFVDYVSFVPSSYYTCTKSSSGSYIGAVSCPCVKLSTGDVISTSITSFCTNTDVVSVTSAGITEIKGTLTSPTSITSSGATINGSNFESVTVGSSSATTYPTGTVWYNPARNTTVTLINPITAESLSITDNEIEVMGVSYESNSYRFTLDNVTFTEVNSSSTFPVTLNQCTDSETSLLYVVIIVFLFGVLYFAFELFSGNFNMYTFVGLLVALVLVGVMRTALFGGCI